MKREAMIDLQNPQLVIGVDLGGTQLRVPVLQAKILAPAALSHASTLLYNKHSMRPT